MALSLSETAAKQVKQLKEAQKLPDSVFLRMGVKGGGCSGMSYMLEFDSEKGPHDKEFEIDGVKVVVDKKSYLYLNGTTLDYVTQGLTGGFTFVNPTSKFVGHAVCDNVEWLNGLSSPTTESYHPNIAGHRDE